MDRSRRGLMLLALLFAATRCANAEDPAFEVASIRPATFRDPYYQAGFYAAVSGSGECQARAVTISGTRVGLTQQSLCNLIVFAYNVRGFQVLGAPSLPQTGGMSESAALVAAHPAFFYDIEARAPGVESSPTEDQVRAMVRSLLADRFGLKIHHETREMPYYAMVIGKRGTKLTPSKPDCRASRTGSGLDAIVHVCGASMQQVLRGLNDAVNKPLVDATGLSGTFDYEIRSHKAEESVVLYDQFLGLTLESRKGPIEVIVVDHVEAPSAN